MVNITLVLPIVAFAPQKKKKSFLCYSNLFIGLCD